MHCVFFGYSPYQERYGRGQQLASRLSKKIKIVYIAPPLSFLRNRIFHPKITQVTENIHEITLPGGFPGRRYLPMYLLSQRYWLHSLKRILDRWGPKEKRIVYAMIPSVGNLMLSIPARMHIYDTHDDWRYIPGDNPDIVEKVERKLADKCDIIVAASLFQEKRFLEMGARVFSLPNACDFSFWQQKENPCPALKDIPRPIFLYYGGFRCFDFPAMLKTVKELPQASFVFLGDIDDDRTSKLRSYSNVYFFGEQPYEELPKWISKTDVCMLPFVLDHWTRGRDCIKLYEYIASGKPVVMNRLAQVERFPHILCINQENTPEGFLQSCREALQQTGKSSRMTRLNIAKEHDWQNRSDFLLQLMMQGHCL